MEKLQGFTVIDAVDTAQNINRNIKRMDNRKLVKDLVRMGRRDILHHAGVISLFAAFKLFEQVGEPIQKITQDSGNKLKSGLRRVSRRGLILPR